MTMDEPEREIGVNQRQLNDRVIGYSKDIIVNLAGITLWIIQIVSFYRQNTCPQVTCIVYCIVKARPPRKL